MSVSQLVSETGISDVTLYTWRKQAVSKGIPSDGKNSDQWTAENKMAEVDSFDVLITDSQREPDTSKIRGKTIRLLVI